MPRQRPEETAQRWASRLAQLVNPNVICSSAKQRGGKSN